MRKRELILLSLSHLLVDGICAATLLADKSVRNLGVAILLYNTLAFSTQCLTGMLPDRFGRGRQLVLLSALMLGLGAQQFLPLMVRAAVLGLGNSLFHVSGGYLTLKSSQTLGPLGIFVAPGAVGLFLGGAWPALRVPMAALFLILAGVLVLIGKEEMTADRPKEGIGPARAAKDRVLSKPPLLLVAFLLLAIAARAIGGSAITFPWKEGLLPEIFLVAAVFLGKSMGGLLADRFGIRPIAFLSVGLAAVLLALGGQWMAPSLLGQWALNLSMPLTLYLLYRLYPDYPGFAFGLAASALWPGVIMGNMIEPRGIWAGILAAAAFLPGLAAILITERRVHHEKN